MFEATEAERKIREINLLMDMQINILFCRTSEHYFSLYLKRLSWDLLKTKNVSSTHAQNFWKVSNHGNLWSCTLKELRSKLATMLKISSVTDVFLGTWPEFTEQLF